MERIVLEKICRDESRFTYAFFVTEGLEKFFAPVPFIVEYSVDVSRVPDAIAAIPFIANVLPIIWLSNSELVLPELDKAFYECIPDLKKGYETMFPGCAFRGKISVEKIVACDIPATGKSAMLYSGGLDATHTLVRHMDERPDMLTVWGSDIRFENQDGWNVMNRGIQETLRSYQLDQVVIRSSFRDFDREGVLTQTYKKRLKDNWWHGVKHGIGLLGHAAPYAYANGVSKLYIASSNCPADGPVRCASNPLTDNQVRFANCRVVHDGFECSRQDKVRDVVVYASQKNMPLHLHVCWQSQSGDNCCRCEKCYRTIAAILAEGADPAAFGFESAWDTLDDMEEYLYDGGLSAGTAKRQWTHIQNRARANREMLKRKGYWKHISWIETINFAKYQSRKEPLQIRIRGYLAKFHFYQVLHRIKGKLYE